MAFSKGEYFVSKDDSVTKYDARLCSFVILFIETVSKLYLFEDEVRVIKLLVEINKIETEYQAASLLVLFCNKKSTIINKSIYFYILLLNYIF